MNESSTAVREKRTGSASKLIQHVSDVVMSAKTDAATETVPDAEPDEVPHTQPQSTDRELRHMSRSELVEVIYALEQDVQRLNEENDDLRARLEDKRIRLESAGSIAEASLSLNHVFEAAQEAADQYVDSVRRQARRQVSAERQTSAGRQASASRQTSTGRQVSAERQVLSGRQASTGGQASLGRHVARGDR